MEICFSLFAKLDPHTHTHTPKQQQQQQYACNIFYEWNKIIFVQQQII